MKAARISPETKIGMRIKDSEENQFCIIGFDKAKDEFHHDVIELRGEAGDKWITADELQYFTKLN